jgi:hypothetical protein
MSSASVAPSREAASGRSSEKDKMERTASSTFISNDDIFAANTFSLDDLKNATLYNFEELKDGNVNAIVLISQYCFFDNQLLFLLE